MNEGISYPVFEKLTAHSQIHSTLQDMKLNRRQQIAQKKPSHKVCSFKVRIKNETNTQIQVIQTLGKAIQQDGYLRCRYKSVIMKPQKQININLLKDYVQKFYYAKFARIFLQEETSNFLSALPESSSSFYKNNQYEYNKGSLMKNSQNQISSLKEKNIPSQSRKDQQKIKSFQIKQENAEQPLSVLGSEQIIIHNSFQTAIEDTQPDSTQVMQVMFEHLTSRKKNYETLFHHQDNKNKKYSAPSPLMFSPSLFSFENCLPVVKLKQGESNKFIMLINKAFKSFLRRGKEVRNKNILLNQQNSSIQADYENSKNSIYSKKKTEQELNINTNNHIQSNSIFDNKRNLNLVEEEFNEQTDNNQEQEEIDNEDDDEEEEEEDNLSVLINQQKSDSEGGKQDFLNQQQYNKNQSFEENELNYTASMNDINRSQITLTSLVLSKKKISQNIQADPEEKGRKPSQSAFNIEKTEQLLSPKSSLRRKTSTSASTQQSQQSKYHNLKNSFMHLIISLFNSEVLSCFEIPEIHLEYTISVIERMKNNSFKYRPVKGRYQYYSNIHYLTLFLKLHSTNLDQIKVCPLSLSYHEIFFNEKLSDCYHNNDFPIIKCNFYKYLIGQIIEYTLDMAENILTQQEFDNQNKYLDCSRYFYISKVKKGIQKLMKGKPAIRF